MGLDTDISDFYGPEMGNEPPFKTQEQKTQEVQEAPVAVMEMDDFYKTEIGQKGLTRMWIWCMWPRPIRITTP